jgi:hypothetical protein
MLDFTFKKIASFGPETVLKGTARGKNGMGFQQVWEVYVLQGYDSVTCWYTYKIQQDHDLNDANAQRAVEQAKEFMEPSPVEEPVFPEAFLQHCPQVKSNGGDKDFAECAFNSAGCGMMCESCGLHLTRPFLDNEVDREFLPQIEEYYAKCAKTKV